MDTSLTAFSQQGPISDPGTYASLFDDLPTSIYDLVRIV